MIKQSIAIFIFIWRNTVSRLFPASCRYYPTCSEYALLCLNKYTFTKALYLITKRILRCNPFSKGGYDPA